MSTVRAAFAALLEQYPLADGKTFAYGTAGFRTTGAHLPPVAVRVAAAVVLRGLCSAPKRGLECKTMGAMVTASHNPAVDNGLKIVDADGGMLSMAWEPLATALANARDADTFAAAFNTALAAVPADMAAGVSLDAVAPCSGVTVIIGCDTRETSPLIVAALKAGVEALGAKVHDIGTVTTPALHWAVWMESSRLLGWSEWINSVAVGFAEYVKTLGVATRRHVVVDCANGVGSKAMTDLQAILAASDANFVAFHLFNTDTADHGKLNNGCGADYAQKAKTGSPEFATIIQEIRKADATGHISCYSIDGDADRIVAFDAFTDASQTRLRPEGAVLLDGDRMIVLFARLVQRIVSELKPQEQPIRLGTVQTAYANGGSTKYIRDSVNVPVALAATGVKYVHPLAATFDVGIYFEANGHGTMLLNDGHCADAPKPPLVDRLRDAAGNGDAAAKQLLKLAAVLSQCCGDAVGDMLAVEAALMTLGWTFSDWSSCYADLPSLQVKVNSSNPNAVQTIADQTRCTAPAGLQEAIDEHVAKVGGVARSFVRPSGTEPIVRVYAEAATAEETKALAAAVEAAVQKFAP